MQTQMILQEDFTNVQTAQAGLTKLFRRAEKDGKFFRVLRNDESLGVLVPDSMWSEWLEEFEALSNPTYVKRIAQARQEPADELYSSDQIKDMIGA